MAFDDNEANSIVEYFIVVLGVVLGFAVTSTVLFSFTSVMEDKSQQARRLTEKLREFKKRLTMNKRIAVSEKFDIQDKLGQWEELDENEATKEIKKIGN